MIRRWCSVCESAGYHMTGCPEDPGPPDGPEADEDERGGEYEDCDPRDMDPVKGAYLGTAPWDDEEPTTIDCWKHLDAVQEARERRVR